MEYPPPPAPALLASTANSETRVHHDSTPSSSSAVQGGAGQTVQSEESTTHGDDGEQATESTQANAGTSTPPTATAGATGGPEPGSAAAPVAATELSAEGVALIFRLGLIDDPVGNFATTHYDPARWVKRLRDHDHTGDPMPAMSTIDLLLLRQKFDMWHSAPPKYTYLEPSTQEERRLDHVKAHRRMANELMVYHSLSGTASSRKRRRVAPPSDEQPQNIADLRLFDLGLWKLDLTSHYRDINDDEKEGAAIAKSQWGLTLAPESKQGGASDAEAGCCPIGTVAIWLHWLYDRDAGRAYNNKAKPTLFTWARSQAMEGKDMFGPGWIIDPIDWYDDESTSEIRLFGIKTDSVTEAVPSKVIGESWSSFKTGGKIDNERVQKKKPRPKPLQNEFVDHFSRVEPNGEDFNLYMRTVSYSRRAQEKDGGIGGADEALQKVRNGSVWTEILGAKRGFDGTNPYLIPRLLIKPPPEFVSPMQLTMEPISSIAPTSALFKYLPVFQDGTYAQELQVRRYMDWIKQDYPKLLEQAVAQVRPDFTPITEIKLNLEATYREFSQLAEEMRERLRQKRELARVEQERADRDAEASKQIRKELEDKLAEMTRAEQLRTAAIEADERARCSAVAQPAPLEGAGAAPVAAVAAVAPPNLAQTIPLTPLSSTCDCRPMSWPNAPHRGVSVPSGSTSIRLPPREAFKLCLCETKLFQLATDCLGVFGWRRMLKHVDNPRMLWDSYGPQALGRYKDPQQIMDDWTSERVVVTGSKKELSPPLSLLDELFSHGHDEKSVARASYAEKYGMHPLLLFKKTSLIDSPGLGWRYVSTGRVFAFDIEIMGQDRHRRPYNALVIAQRNKGRPEVDIERAQATQDLTKAHKESKMTLNAYVEQLSSHEHTPKRPGGNKRRRSDEAGSELRSNGVVLV
ncbi:BQ2448_2699 [Microbotryum intermedium]|uniref:BQ2448_2699 protein n=1 Tax=Microbotryum intermedium TaxID=269621 RepID=A0A238FG57_9BASI|nr:BQ2448_2699 [Microbotryum intermedium]